MIVAEQMQQHWHPTAGNPWRLGDPKQFLDADSHHRLIPDVVANGMPLAVGQFDLGGCEPVAFGQSLVAYGGLQSRQPIGGSHLIERGEPQAEIGQHRHERCRVERLEPKVGQRGRQPPDAAPEGSRS